MVSVIGWDIGGAHLKAARVDAGRVTAAAQVATPLWLGLDSLDAAFVALLRQLGDADIHAVTMTGELCDAFASRRDGVVGLAGIAARHLAPASPLLYAGSAGFVALAAAGERAEDIASANWHASAALVGLRLREALFIDIGSTTTDVIPVVAGRVAAIGHTDAGRLEAGERAEDIASANWHASAALVGRRLREALFIDIGSTTTDVIPVVAGKVAAIGHTDAGRLEAGELVYTGMARSFVMAMAARAPYGGRWTPLMNEYFASSADVHRILGALPDGADKMASADGRDKSVAASRLRLARMIGREGDEADDGAWDRLAAWFAEAQLRDITDAAMLRLSRGDLPGEAPVVAAGVGEQVAVEAARRLGRACVGFASLIAVGAETATAASQCAPAVAVALLAAAGAGT